MRLKRRFSGMFLCLMQSMVFGQQSGLSIQNQPLKVARDYKIQPERPDAKLETLTPADAKYLNRITRILSESPQCPATPDASQRAVVPMPIDTVSESLLKKRLEQLDAQTPMDLHCNPVVKAYIEQYLKAGKLYPKVLGLATYYFPLFEELLDQYDLPLEIKYLSIVESGLNPRAVSRSGAAGLWQFTYGTARLYGLKINSYVDERYNPYLATVALCRYMSYLHGLFGDWNLALAAYNAGPGNVARAIRRAGGKKNYWNIRRFLPWEARRYVPAFIAYNYLVHYAKKHGLKAILPKICPYNVDTVRIKRTVSFDQLSKFLAIPKMTLASLNPAFKRSIIPGTEDHPYTVCLPRKKAIELADDETAFYAVVKADSDKREKVAIQWLAEDQASPERLIWHRIKRGESLSTIAEKYRVKVSQLKRWNHLRGSTIRSGRTLKVYTRRHGARNSKRHNAYHRILSGETLSQIATHYQTTVAALRTLNHLEGSQIKAGETIRVR